MSKADDLLSECRANLNRWTCAYCASNSNQPAATFRELKKRGFKFEEVSPNRWGKTMYCSKCNEERTHYKLLEYEPQFSEKPRISITGYTRTHILSLFDGKDAFSGASISSTPEIDHKTPWTRLDSDIDASVLNDSDIRSHFQLLTREHNLLKDRMCSHCKNNNIRPPFFGINYWYAGDEHYIGTCEGCGWYDGEKWKEEINKKMKNE